MKFSVFSLLATVFAIGEGIIGVEKQLMLSALPESWYQTSSPTTGDYYKATVAASTAYCNPEFASSLSTALGASRFQSKTSELKFSLVTQTGSGPYGLYVGQTSPAHGDYYVLHNPPVTYYYDDDLLEAISKQLGSRTYSLFTSVLGLKEDKAENDGKDDGKDDGKGDGNSSKNDAAVASLGAGALVLALLAL